MQDASEHIPASDRPLARIMRELNRTLLIQPLMRAPLVIEGDVLRQHALQMSLIQDEQPVQTLLAGRAHPPLGDAVLLGSPRRSIHHFKPFTAEHGVETRRELPVTIVE